MKPRTTETWCQRSPSLGTILGTLRQIFLRCHWRCLLLNSAWSWCNSLYILCQDHYYICSEVVLSGFLNSCSLCIWFALNILFLCGMCWDLFIEYQHCLLVLVPLQQLPIGVVLWRTILYMRADDHGNFDLLARRIYEFSGRSLNQLTGDLAIQLREPFHRNTLCVRAGSHTLPLILCTIAHMLIPVL
jgi:hypothetical protein